MVATQIPGPDQMTPQAASAALNEFNVVSQVSEQELFESGLPMPHLRNSNTFRLGQSKAYCLIYWRKPPVEDTDGNMEPGDITTGGAWAGEYSKNLSLGWTPLPQYGRFDDSNPAEPGGAWQPSKDKYRRILRHPKGPAEFTLRQVMEMCAGDLRKLPKNVVFPCLATEEGKAAIAARVRCNFCGRWAKNEQDLYAHQRVRHSDDANIDKQARQQATLLGDALKETGGQSAVVADKLVEVVSSIAARQEASDRRFEQLLASLPGMIAAAAGSAPKAAASKPVVAKSKNPFKKNKPSVDVGEFNVDPQPAE